MVPAGRTFAHADLLHLRTAGLRVAGGGTLLATREERSSVWVEAPSVTLSDVTLRTATTSHRWVSFEQMGLRLASSSGTVVRGVTVVGAAAAGVYVGGSDHFTLDHVTVVSSRADGIHTTGGSHDGSIVAPLVQGSGDDGVAVVSYRADGAVVHDVSVVSPTVLGTTWGRGLSVVGGRDITLSDIHVERSDAAGVYIASEAAPYFTFAPERVTVSGGAIIGANTNRSVDHGAILIMSDDPGFPPKSIVVRGVAVRGTRASASWSVGLVSYADSPSALTLDGISVVDGPRSALGGNLPGGAYTTTGWTVKGVAVPDHRP